MEAASAGGTQARASHETCRATCRGAGRSSSGPCTAEASRASSGARDRATSTEASVVPGAGASSGCEGSAKAERPVAGGKRARVLCPAATGLVRRSASRAKADGACRGRPGGMGTPAAVWPGERSERSGAGEARRRARRQRHSAGASEARL